MRSFKRSFNLADNYETPSCLVELLVPFLKEWTEKFETENGRKSVIWCPFDKSHSKYVEIFKREGFDVVNTHISENGNFFDVKIDYDIAISNPPFSLKKDIFEKFYREEKPFVMLMNMMAVNYQEIGELFYKMGTSVQFLIPDKKVSFNGATSSFCSGYVCYKFIPKTIFVHLENNNTGSNFRK